MKINGSLVFDDSGLSQITNLRVEKVSALPTFGSSDIGRLVYVTGSQVLWLGGATAWISLATGGDAAGLAAEVDAIEASLGGLLKADGTYDASALTGTLAGSTSVTDVLSKLQALIAGNTTAISNEVTARETAVAGVQTDVDNLEITVEGIRQNFVTDLATERDARIAGDAANATAISAETTAREAADTALGGRIDAEEDRATAAEQALDGRITTEVSDRTAAVNAVATDLAAEVTARTDADTALGTRIDQEITRATSAEAAIRGELASAVAGLTWEAPVDLLATTAASVDLTGKANGYRIVDLTSKTVYTVTDGALDAGEALVDGAAFFNRTNDTGYVYNGTDVVPFTGASSFVAGAGLSLDGNTVNVGNTDGSITVTADNIAVSQSVRDEITANATAIAAETTRATTAEAGLDDRIDDEVQARIDAIANEVTARDAAILVETNRATTAEQALGTRITTLDSNTNDALVDLYQKISNETTVRANEDSSLSERITAVDGLFDNVYFLYEGASAASHTVAHGLGVKYCNVTVVDADDEVVIPQSIKFDSNNQLTVTFNSSIACKVVVMAFGRPA